MDYNLSAQVTNQPETSKCETETYSYWDKMGLFTSEAFISLSINYKTKVFTTNYRKISLT